MQNPLLKEKLICAGDSKAVSGSKSILGVLSRITRFKRGVEKKRVEISGEDRAWLLENYYLIEKASREISRTKRKRFSRLLPWTQEFVRWCDTPRGEDMSALFEVLTKNGGASDSELENVKTALIYSCVCEICERCESGEALGVKIELLRRLRVFDMTPLITGFSASERYLRSDPAGVWQKMSRESRELYKRKIRKMARSEGKSFEEMCRAISAAASESSRHIGEYIEFRSGAGAVYYPALLLIFALFLLLAARLVTTGGFLGALIYICLIVPVFEMSSSFAGFLMSLFNRSDILPRVELDAIGESVSTLVVIPALVSKKSEAEELFSHLEKLYLKSKSRRGEDTALYFGLLVDLPESDRASLPSDREIIDLSQKRVESLNSRYGGHFALFWRDRVYDESSGKYIAPERKRGALLELAKYCLKKSSKISAHGASLPKIKYIVTLDSDTDMRMGDLSKMVGTMEHPLNRPHLSEKGGEPFVESGYGILQPRIISSLSSSYKTPFSLLVSGAGGFDTYHSPVFDLFFVLHRRAMFCGKGIFDVECYVSVLENAFPDNIILSHDMLEGSRLRAGLIPDLVFSDSVPKNIISYYKRAHRWARGDTQSLVFTTPRVVNRRGRLCRNPQRLSDRFVFFVNFLALLSPVFSCLALFLSMNLAPAAAGRVFIIALSPLWLYSATALVLLIFRLSFVTLFRRFFTKALTGVVREILWLLYSVSALFFRAWNNFSAVTTSVFRLAVTKKKLLEWSTASQVEGSAVKNDGILRYFIFCLPSTLAGIFLMIFSSAPWTRLAGVFFLSFFAVGYITSKKSERRFEVTEAQKNKLISYAERTWKFFDTFVDRENNFLPCDNVSVQPSYEVAHRTSPTNIGLYLISTLAARDFGFIDSASLAERLEASLEALEKMPKYRGHLYNWYDTRTLEVIGEAYISTVDSGNLAACLVALREGLCEYYGEDGRLAAIAERVRALESGMDFKFLYDTRRRLFSLGYNTEKGERDSGCYDLYMSEARTTDYYAVARGIAEKEHWSTLSRSLIARHMLIGSASWSGTAFEYFMPHLFLPIYENSFADEALSFAFSEQVYYSARFQKVRLWGTSESGYFAFDRDMNYQYRAFGVPSLALSVKSSEDRVISPYSTFLMLSENVSLCLKNLDNLERAGMRGEFGFYEAIDFSPDRAGGGYAMVKSYMAHHVGMSIVAIANTVLDGIFTKRFMRDAEMNSASELLEERVPVDALIIKSSSERSPEREAKLLHLFVPDSQSLCRNGERLCTALLTGKDSHLLAGERGIVGLGSRDITFISPRPMSFLPYCRAGDKIFSPSCEKSQLLYGRGNVRYKGEVGDIVINLSGTASAVRVRAVPRGDRGAVTESGIYFEPSMVSRASYVAHPAYTELFYEGRQDPETGAVYLEYRGKNPFTACFLSDKDFEFELFRERVFEKRECNESSLFDYIKKTARLSCTSGTLLSPCLLARASGTGESVFVLGFGKTCAEAYRAAKEELERSTHKSLGASDEFERRLLSSSGCEKPDRELGELILSALREREGFRLCDTLPEVSGREALWKWGISGDLPIVMVSGELEEEELEKIFCHHKYHYIASLRYDMAVICRDSGYSQRTRDRVLRAMERTKCRFMENQSGGIYVLGPEAESIIRSSAGAIIEKKSDIRPLPPAEHFAPQLRRAEHVRSTKPCGFEGESYIIDKSEYNPSILWHHIIASESFGTLLSCRSLGHTWAYNAGLARLDVWENDRVGGGRSEKLYLFFDGSAYDVCEFASRVEFSPGKAVYTSRLFEVTVSCHPGLLYKEVSVKLLVSGKVSLIYKLSPVMGDGTVMAGGCVARDMGFGIKFVNPFSSYFKKGFGYLVTPLEKSTATPFGIKLEKNVSLGDEIRFVLGFAGSEEHFARAFERASERSCRDESVGFAKSFLPKREGVFFKGAADAMYKTFIPWQCAVSRVLARTGPYQSGGAWGGRDQTQDMLFLIDVCPERVRAHLFRVAAHQYVEGDIQHWWHGFRGTRTKCSDDYLWFVLLLAEYIDKTGESDFLNQEVRYLSSTPLSEDERERYELPHFSELRENLILHAKRALDLFVSRGTGVHGIPFMGSGDWNDGMDMMGRGGGESVWLGFFAISVFYRSFPMFEKFGIDTSAWRSFCLGVYDSIEKHAFFTDRYARAFLSDGSVAGCDGFGSGCTLDSLVGAAASVCMRASGLGNPSRISAALDLAWRELYDEKNKIFKLFSPPFREHDPRVGYVSSYPEGVRENGGQYTHGAVFAALGYLFAPAEKRKNLERAEKILEAVLPCGRTEAFMTEPYVLSADIYSNPSHPGRGGWSFYTGSAGWCSYLMSLILKEKME